MAREQRKRERNKERMEDRTESIMGSLPKQRSLKKTSKSKRQQINIRQRALKKWRITEREKMEL